MKTRLSLLIGAALVALALYAGVALPQDAGATPNKQQDCTKCHGDGTYAATVTATPSATALSPGASYTLPISISENAAGSFNTGYWIANSTAAGATGTTTGVYAGATSTTQSYAVSMTAPGTPGTYYYKVFMEDGPQDVGIVGFKTYSITVAASVHDVAVTYLGYPRKSHAYLGSAGDYSAVYANHGNVSETFTATFTAQAPNGTKSTLDTRSITLAAGASTTVDYSGLGTFSQAGVWTIAATAGPVAGETATADDTYSRTRTIYGATSVAPVLRVRFSGHRGR